MENNLGVLERKAVAVVILAAGYSSRMGAFKALLPVGEQSAIERIICEAKACGVERIAVVTGHGREQLQPVMDREGVGEVFNPDFQQGMFTSIRAGAAALRGLETDMLLWPVDCPLVPAEVLRELCDAGEAQRPAFMVPCYNGKKGHPLLIHKEYIKGVAEYSGENGLKGFIEGRGCKMVRHETCFEGVVMDMDTPEGYKEILEYAEGKTSRPEFTGRLFLLRHGETEQHEEPVFIGQLDVPLSELGRKQAFKAGLELSDCSIDTDIIYASDLSRARDTAEIVKAAVRAAFDGKEMELVLEPEFREMKLGFLEGMPIRQFRRENPEEYEARGQSLAAYKKGNDSENFYDLQYRVMKKLEKLMASQPHRDLVLVAHAGVIRVILSNIAGYPLEEALKIDIPKGSIIKIEQGEQA